MRAVPEVGGTSVVNMRMRVDLPAPFGPEQAEHFAVVDGEAQRVHGDKSRRSAWSDFPLRRRAYAFPIALASGSVT